MDRPALRRLLYDIAAGKADVVVVYKIDRLMQGTPACSPAWPLTRPASD